MRIGIVGDGKMGQSIAKLAPSFGAEVLWIKSRHTPWDELSTGLKDTDVAIEFTEPESAFLNCQYLLTKHIPVVCGTTGWGQYMQEIIELTLNGGEAFFYASNFSPGVNVVFELNRRLSAMSQWLGSVQVKINETHHQHKKDSPSGTALTLSEPWITGESPIYNSWTLDANTSENALPIHACREGDVFGIHEVVLETAHDLISIRHEALDRSGFAIGALLAARWLIGKKGYFSMRDLFEME